MKSIITAGAGAMLLLALATCSSITTETGSVDSRQRSAEIRASELRTNWASKLEFASGPEVGIELAKLIRHASQIYRDYGSQIAARWHEGNEGRGTPIPASEMQQRVPNWIAGEEPILKAYDGMVDFAVSKLRESDLLNVDDVQMYENLVATYDRLYSAVAYPKGSVADYEYEVGVLVSKVETQSDAFEGAMNRFD